MDATCTRCHSPLAPEDLRCAICALPVPDSVRAQHVGEEQAQILRCHGCGAAVRYDAKVQAPSCDFCRAVMEVETPEDPIEQAEAYIDFAITAEQAREALSGWLGNRGFFRPSDLQSSSAVDGLKPLWWVGWCFDADAHVCWTADSDRGAHQSAWAPHSGEFEMNARNVVVSASVGLSDEECRELLPYYDLSKRSEQPQGFEDATIEEFSVQRSAARQIIARALEAEARHRARDRIPGTQFRKVHASVLPSRLDSRHYAFPAYVLAYRYRDKLYRAVVNGQSPDCVMGEAPLSWARVLLVVVAGIAVLGILLAVLSASLR